MVIWLQFEQHGQLRQNDALFNTLNTRQIIELQGLFEDKRANLMQQNRPVPLDILLVILLLREQVHHRFELIRIVLMAIPETMDNIKQT